MKVSKLVMWIGICFAFCNVVWAMDLEQSFMAKAQDSLKQEYLEVAAESEKDSSQPFFYYISKKPTHRWPALVSQSFKDEKSRVTTADLLFAIKHSNLSSNKDAKYKSLFELAIIERLLHKNPENQISMSLLLTQASIKREPGWGWSADKFESEMTLLTACLEDGHIDAFNTILNAWPKEAKNPLASTAIITTIQVPDPNPSNNGFLFSNYVPAVTHYNLVQWLLRFEACNMIGRYPKKNYIDAAGFIVKFVKERGYDDTDISVFKPYLESSEGTTVETKKEPLPKAEPQDPTPDPIVLEQQIAADQQKQPKDETKIILEQNQAATVLEDLPEPEEQGFFSAILDGMANITIW